MVAVVGVGECGAERRVAACSGVERRGAAWSGVERRVAERV